MNPGLASDIMVPSRLNDGIVWSRSPVSKIHPNIGNTRKYENSIKLQSGEPQFLTNAQDHTRSINQVTGSKGVFISDAIHEGPPNSSWCWNFPTGPTGSARQCSMQCVPGVENLAKVKLRIMCQVQIRPSFCCLLDKLPRHRAVRNCWFGEITDSSWATVRKTRKLRSLKMPELSTDTLW